MTRQITNTAEGQTSDFTHDGWELINVLPLPMNLYKLFESVIVNSFN